MICAIKMVRDVANGDFSGQEGAFVVPTASNTDQHLATQMLPFT